MLIGLTGYARSGKDTAATVLIEKFGFVKLALADPVRQLAEAIDPIVAVNFSRAKGCHDVRYTDLLRDVGYEQAKQNPEFRRTLQRIGTEAMRDIFGPDVWVQLLWRRIGALTYDKPHTNIIVTDVRFPNEVKAIRGWGGRVWRINRGGQTSTDPHPSEAQIPTLDVNRDIANDGTLEDLRQHIIDTYMEAQ